MSRGSARWVLFFDNHVDRLPFGRFEHHFAIQIGARAAHPVQKHHSPCDQHETASFDFDSARISISRALALKPQDPNACNNLAWLLATGPAPVRDPEKAIELAQTAMENDVVSKRSINANTLGVAQYRAGKFQDALEMLKESLTTQTQESQPFDLYFLSMCSSKLGDYIAARDFFDRAEALKNQFRSTLPFDQQAELDEFSTEAKSLLSQSDL